MLYLVALDVLLTASKMSMLHRTYLQLGCNMGNRRIQILKAQKLLNAALGEPVSQSYVYETAAWGVTKKQHDYFNQVLGYDTTLEPLELLDLCLDIERQLGRVRREPWGPRSMDIDILLYADRVIKTKRLTIPHALLHKRRFVLEPLAEIAGDIVHPILDTSIADLCAAVNGQSSIRKMGFA